jgi:hypothetical protein
MAVFDPKYVANNAPAAAPIALPAKRCHDTVSAAPSEDCMTTNVVIAAQ